MERYRSGHNEAVLKTVCPQGRVGSNPTLSAYLAVSERASSFGYCFFAQMMIWLILPIQKKSKEITKISLTKETTFSMILNALDKSAKLNSEMKIEQIWRSTQAGRRDTPGKGAGR